MGVTTQTSLAGLGVGPLEIRSSDPGNITVPPGVSAVIAKSNAIERGSEVAAGFADGTNPHFEIGADFAEAGMGDPALTGDQLGLS